MTGAPVPGSGRSTERVVVLAGPSGAGKTRLAGRLQSAYRWPVVRLDDFYREGGDPGLPVVDLGGSTIVDWDDPGSWDGEAAVTALRELVRSGSAAMPSYDIGRSAVVGTTRLEAAGDALVLAEGIFAAEIIGRLHAERLLHSAWCVRQSRSVTFVRRLVRDLAERRKPPMVLVRRGLALCRAEPALVARMEALGAVPASPAAAERAIAASR